MKKVALLTLVIVGLTACTKPEIKTPITEIDSIRVAVNYCIEAKERLHTAKESQATLLPDDQLLAIKISTLEEELSSCKTSLNNKMSLASPDTKSLAQYQTYDNLRKEL